MLRTLVSLGFVGCVALVGCAPNSDSLDDEKSVTEASALDHETSSAELDAVDTLEPTKAAVVAAAVKTDGCRTRTVDANDPHVVHVTLNGCTGRFMRHVVNGTATITFSTAADGRLHAESVGNFTVDGRPFTRKVSSDISIAGDVRTTTRHVERNGTKENGESVVHTADETVTFDRSTRCRTVNGTGKSLIGNDRTVETTLTDLRTCELPDGTDQCPTGTYEHVNQTKGKTVLATFDGSANATVEISRPKGEKTRTWPLDCTAR